MRTDLSLECTRITVECNDDEPNEESSYNINIYDGLPPLEEIRIHVHVMPATPEVARQLAALESALTRITEMGRMLAAQRLMDQLWEETKKELEALAKEGGK